MKILPIFRELFFMAVAVAIIVGALYKWVEFDKQNRPAATITSK